MPVRRAAFPAMLLFAAGCSVVERDQEPPPVLAPQGPQLPLTPFAEEMLAMHNRERSLAGVPAVQWDDGLAAGAAAYGPELARFEGLRHSAQESRPGEGENLWLGTANRYSFADMFRSWAEEKRFFRAGIFPDVATEGDWRGVGHYTQLIWPRTQRIGCAVHRTQRWDYLICRYAPVGNVVGQPVP